jgi:hypothetical protein
MLLLAMRRLLSQRHAICALVLMAGCEVFSGLDQFGDAPETTSSASTSSAGGGVATTSTGGAGAGGSGVTTGIGGATSSSGAGGMTGSSGAGGAGGAVPPLVDDGLLARYFLDEAASGSAPAAALDAAPSPFDLPIDYGSLPNAVGYVEVQGNRGLGWNAIDLTGKPSATLPAAGKIISALDGSTTATIEVVVNVEQFQTVNNFFWNMRAANGRLALASGAGSDVKLIWNGDVRAGAWDVDLTVSDRVILHAVLDTSSADASQRARLYVGGVPQAANGTATAPTKDEGIALQGISGIDLALGNWADGTAHSFKGALHYAALYDTALTPAQVQQNHDALLASDDTP